MTDLLLMHFGHQEHLPQFTKSLNKRDGFTLRAPVLSRTVAPVCAIARTESR